MVYALSGNKPLCRKTHEIYTAGTFSHPFTTILICFWSCMLMQILTFVHNRYITKENKKETCLFHNVQKKKYDDSWIRWGCLHVYQAPHQIFQFIPCSISSVVYTSQPPSPTPRSITLCIKCPMGNNEGTHLHVTPSLIYCLFEQLCCVIDSTEPWMDKLYLCHVWLQIVKSLRKYTFACMYCGWQAFLHSVTEL